MGEREGERESSLVGNDHRNKDSPNVNGCYEIVLTGGSTGNMYIVRITDNLRKRRVVKSQSISGRREEGLFSLAAQD